MKRERTKRGNLPDLRTLPFHPPRHHKIQTRIPARELDQEPRPIRRDLLAFIGEDLTEQVKEADAERGTDVRAQHDRFALRGRVGAMRGYPDEDDVQHVPHKEAAPFEVRAGCGEGIVEFVGHGGDPERKHLSTTRNGLIWTGKEFRLLSLPVCIGQLSLLVERQSRRFGHKIRLTYIREVRRGLYHGTSWQCRRHSKGSRQLHRQ